MIKIILTISIVNLMVFSPACTFGGGEENNKFGTDEYYSELAIQLCRNENGNNEVSIDLIE